VKGIAAAVVTAVVAIPVLLLALLSPASPATAGVGDCPAKPEVFAEAHMQPNAVALGRCIAQMWPQLTVIGGWRPEDPYADHPSGQALDVMMPNGGHTAADVALGNEIATWIMSVAESHRVVYVLWRHRIWNYAGMSPHEPVRPPDQWRLASENGAWTPNHMDHLHIATDGSVALGGQSAPGAGFDGPPPAADSGGGAGGGFIDPIPGAVIVSETGMRFHPVYRENRCHTGADINGGYGAPIRAIANGTITSAGPNGGYGNMTVIDHGDGLTSAYAHQSRFARGPGPIRQGDILGYVGDTGTVTGPHLHLEIRINGVPQNPRGWLPGGNPSQRAPAC
jgi:hypothetical protein